MEVNLQGNNQRVNYLGSYHRVEEMFKNVMFRETNFFVIEILLTKMRIEIYPDILHI